MGIFGKGKKKPKKQSRKKRLGNAFDIPLSSSPRERAAAARAAAGDKAIAILARENKKNAARDAMIEKAEALKEAAQARKDAAAEREKQKREREKQQKQREQAAEDRTACTCRRPTLRNGKCTRCRKAPGSRRRR